MLTPSKLSKLIQSTGGILYIHFTLVYALDICSSFCFYRSEPMETDQDIKEVCELLLEKCPTGNPLDLVI
jgi:hypothetical protein